MASNFFRIKNGENLQPVSGSTVTVQGDVAYNSSTNQVEVYTTTTEKVATDSNTLTFSNKSITSAQISDATAAATASVIVARDANANTRANNFIDGYATTATAAGTTTLTVASTCQQYFTGSTTQTVVLPVTSTLVLGQQYVIVNNSSGIVTVQSSGANTVATLGANIQTTVTCILTSGTGASSWSTSATASGVLPVASGGTGDSTLTAHNVLIGEGTSPVAFAAPGATTGVPLVSNGASSDPSFGTASIGGGGTGVTSVTTSPTASAWAGWDANSNLSAANLLDGYTTTATAAGTTTLTVASKAQQYFTGSTTQTVQLPVTSTLVLGQSFTIVNLSTGVVTVQSSGANNLQAMATNTQLIATCISTSGTGIASWNATYQGTSITAPVNPTVQKFTSGTAQTYTTPSGVQYLRVRMVGGGGGGASSSGANNSPVGVAGNAGTASTFFNASAGGGAGGASGSGSGGAGGTSSLGAGAIGTALPGGAGGPGGQTTSASTNGLAGGIGGSSVFAGAGTGGNLATSGTGSAGATNTGGGGGGGLANSGAVNANAGAGGGGGGYVDMIITSPAATYTYTVGASGAAGGSGSVNGSAGAAGVIIVEEFYSNISISASSSVSANTILAGPSSGAAAIPTFRGLVAADMPAVVAAIIQGAPQQSYSANTAIKFPTTVQDTNTAYSASTGQFTVPTGEGGYYQVSMAVDSNDSTSAAVSVYVNNSKYSVIGFSSTAGVMFGSGLVYATAGQTIDVRYARAWTATGSGVNETLTIAKIGY